MGYAYRYDQLNRLKAMTAFAGLDSNRWMPASGTTAWNTSYDYDPNGNLLSLTRNDAAGTLMDNLSYRYDTVSRRLLNNRLLSVNDPVNGGHGDIYDLHEYQYDAIGNLVKDESEGVDSIIWDAYGKVYQILRTDTSSKPELEFRYDAMGNRIMKIAKHGTNQENWVYSIYSRDATGNVIAVYERKWTSTTALTSPDADLVLQVPTHPGLGSGLIGIKINGIYLTNGPILTESTTAGTATTLANAVNAYETESFDFTAEVDGDLVFLFTEEEYTEPLNFEILNTDVDFIGSEYFDFIAPKIRGFKPHSGTFTQVPLFETVALQELHLYGSSRLGIKTPYLQVDKQQVKSAYVNNYGDSLYLSYLDSRMIPLVNPADGPFFENEKGLKQYELANHLGNVLVVFEDKKVSHQGTDGEVGSYTASLLSIQDYFPFGWTMPGRGLNVPDYRFGFNGKESIGEVYGSEGTYYDYGFRVYSPLDGRFKSIDPLFRGYPWYSPYHFAGNNPTTFVDLDGREPTRAQLYWVPAPELEKELWGEDVEHVVLYATHGIHSTDPGWQLWDSPMLVAQTNNSYVNYNGQLYYEQQYYYFDNGTRKWILFEPNDMVDPDEVSRISVVMIGTTALVVGGLQIFGPIGLLKEGGEEIFEATTGIPVVTLDAVEVIEQVGKRGYKYWIKQANFKGKSVYQRDDLIDPNFVDARGRTNIQRMEKGLAPIGPDGKSMHLHHTTQTDKGSYTEMTKTFHTENSSVIHINQSNTPSGINRPKHNKFKRQYWKERAKDFKNE